MLQVIPVQPQQPQQLQQYHRICAQLKDFIATVSHPSLLALMLMYQFTLTSRALRDTSATQSAHIHA
jgi:hypothetical protein